MTGIVIDFETPPPKSNGTVAVTVTVEGPADAGEFDDWTEEFAGDDVVPEPPQLSNPVAAITSRASIMGICIFRKRSVSFVAVKSQATAMDSKAER